MVFAISAGPEMLKVKSSEGFDVLAELACMYDIPVLSTLALFTDFAGVFIENFSLWTDCLVVFKFISAN